MSLVQQIDNGYIASYRLFGSLNAFRRHAVNTLAKKGACSAQKEHASPRSPNPRRARAVRAPQKASKQLVSSPSLERLLNIEGKN